MLSTERVPAPTAVSAVTPRAVAIQVVRLSGMSTSTTALPSPPVVTVFQSIVSAKLERISVAAYAGAPPFRSAPSFRAPGLPALLPSAAWGAAGSLAALSRLPNCPPACLFPSSLLASARPQSR